MKYAELRNLNCGDRVVMTQEGIDQGLIGRAIMRNGTVYGTVITTQPDSGLLRVRRDGIAGSESYASNFWGVDLALAPQEG